MREESGQIKADWPVIFTGLIGQIGRIRRSLSVDSSVIFSRIEQQREMAENDRK